MKNSILNKKIRTLIFGVLISNDSYSMDPTNTESKGHEKELSSSAQTKVCNLEERPASAPSSGENEWPPSLSQCNEHQQFLVNLRRDMESKIMNHYENKLKERHAAEALINKEKAPFVWGEGLKPAPELVQAYEDIKLLDAIAPHYAIISTPIADLDISSFYLND